MMKMVSQAVLVRYIGALIGMTVLPDWAFASGLPQLNCQLGTVENSETGGAIQLQFTLKNMSGRGVYVLTWNTPLEEMPGPGFRITRNGKVFPYVGPQLKRTDPPSDDYLLIGPRDSVTVLTDLTSSYGLTSPGIYQISFQSRLLDWAWEDQQIPRLRSGHQSLPLVCGPVLAHLKNH